MAECGDWNSVQVHFHATFHVLMMIHMIAVEARKQQSKSQHEVSLMVAVAVARNAK